MNIKSLIAFVVLIAIGIFGYSYFSSKKHEERLATMRAESAKVQAETARLEAEQKEAEQKPIASQIPLNQGGQTSVTEAKSSASAIEIKQINFENEDKAKIEDIRKRWDSSRVLANSTARIALAPKVKDMQAEKRELEILNVTKCLTPAKDKLLAAMKLNEDSFLAFMDDATLGKYIAQSKVQDVENNVQAYEQIARLCN